VENAAALAGLYMDAKAWDKARALIDQIKTGHESSRLVASLDARWHADRGDIEKARQVYVALIEAVGKEQSPMPPEPYRDFGQFMLAHGRSDLAIVAFLQAERLQNPKTMDVSQYLGDVYMSLGRFDDAEAVFRKVLKAGVPDPRLDLRKRLIESLVQQRKMADAEKEFVDLGPAADSDVELLSQRAQVARDMGDAKRAREILDRAVSRFPDEPLAYLRRARLSMLESTTVGDAMADLDTAIKLRPSMWQARRTRAFLLLSSGDTDRAVKDLQEAVDANPGLDLIRMEFIQLLLRLGREGDAVETADAAVKLRPTDTRLLGSLGEKFARAGRWARATRYYRSAWEQLGDAPSAAAYVTALLSATPPGLSEADAVLATPGLRADRSAELLLARAQLRRKQKNEEAAQLDAVSAFGLAAGDPRQLDAWIRGVRRIFTEPRPCIAVLDAVRPPAALNDWRLLQRSVVMVGDPAMRSEGMANLRTLSDSPTADKRLRADAIRFLADAAANDSKWEDMLALCKRGLELLPDDALFNNNAAYALSEYLNRPAEALPYAEKAVTASPDQDRILDTLAGVYWKLGNKEKAIQAETAALRHAAEGADKVQWLLKLAGWKLESGDQGGARGLLDSLRELLNDNPALVEAWKPKVDQLEKDIGAAR
jgi:tetratricopeptide (TPR) repeat protein